jgi:hypothetical protein
MREFLIQYFSNKQLYFFSVSMGTILSMVVEFFSKNTPRELFGISISLWFIAFLINLIDIHTGIKADTVRKEKLGKKFKFESNKAWRALEKIVVFTIIIFWAYSSEKEVIRLQLPLMIATIILYIKMIFFSYVILIETQSIGENEEERFGKKSKGFLFLDRIIEIVNEGLFSNLKKLFKINS